MARPTIERNNYSGEEYHICSHSPEDVHKIGEYLKFINKFDEKALKGNPCEKTKFFRDYIINGGKWYFNKVLLRDIEEAIDILWPDV